MRLSVHLLIALLLAATDASAQPSFSAPLELAAGTDPAAVATADLTGDSNLDLVVVSRTSDDAHVYVGDGNGGFVFLQSFSVGNFPQGVGAADLDGDTRQDLVTTAVPFNTGTATPWLRCCSRARSARSGSGARRDRVAEDAQPALLPLDVLPGQL